MEILDKNRIKDDDDYGDKSEGKEYKGEDEG